MDNIQDQLEDSDITSGINDETEPDIDPDTDLEDQVSTENTIAAVIEFRGKQYFVRIGSDVEFICKDPDIYELQGTVDANNIKMACKTSGNEVHPVVKFGSPYLEGASAKLSFQTFNIIKGVSFKKRRRKHSSKTTRGYKNIIVRLRVDDITVPGM